MPLDPLRHLVVLAHPRRGSFNHQLADAYCETVRACGQIAFLRDLYATRFDPILEHVPEAPELDSLDDVAAVRNCDILVFVYPIWFGLPPAMIKGYVDRVLGAGFAPSRDHPRADERFLGGKQLLSISTSASTEAWLAEQGQMLSLREGFDQYLGTVFGLARTQHVHVESVVEDLNEQYAAEQIARIEEVARSTCADLLHAARGEQATGALKAYADRLMDPHP